MNPLEANKQMSLSGDDIVFHTSNKGQIVICHKDSFGKIQHSMVTLSNTGYEFDGKIFTDLNKIKENILKKKESLHFFRNLARQSFILDNGVPLTLKQAENLIHQGKENLVFRPSSKGENYIAISYFHPQHYSIFHERIKITNKGFEYQETTFETLEQIASHLIRNLKSHSSPQEKARYKPEFEEKWKDYSFELQEIFSQKMMELNKPGEKFFGTKISRRQYCNEMININPPQSLIITRDGTIIPLIHSTLSYSPIIGEGGYKRAKHTQKDFVLAVVKKNKYSPRKRRDLIIQAIPLFEKYREMEGLVSYYPIHWECTNHTPQVGILSEKFWGDAFTYFIDGNDYLPAFPIALNVLASAAKGLAIMHEHNNVHMDVKLENIFVKENDSHEQLKFLSENYDNGSLSLQDLIEYLKNKPIEGRIADYDQALTLPDSHEIVDLAVRDTPPFTPTYGLLEFLEAIAYRKKISNHLLLRNDLEAFSRITFVIMGYGDLNEEIFFNQIKHTFLNNQSLSQLDDSEFYNTDYSCFDIVNDPLARLIWRTGMIKDASGNLCPDRDRIQSMRVFANELTFLAQNTADLLKIKTRSKL